MGRGKAPQAKKVPHLTTQFNEAREDPYHWMRDNDWQQLLQKPHLLDADIRAHLEAENDYFSAYAKGFEPLQNQITQEMKGRIIEKDSSVPLRDGGWEYWSEYREGGDYKIFMRRNMATGAAQVVFDGDKEKGGSKFFNIGGIDHSPDQKTIAYSVDREGSEYFTIRFRDIETGAELPESITMAEKEGAWSKDSSVFYYVECDENHRPKRVKAHVLGTDPKNDAVVYEEQDDAYELTVGESLSGEYIFIASAEKDTTEVRYLKSDSPAGTQPALFAARKTGHQYDVEHRGGHFYILTNKDGAVESKIMKTPVGATETQHWTDVVPYDPAVSIPSMFVLKDYMVRTERRNALSQIVVTSFADGSEYRLKFDDEAYAAGTGPGFMFDAEEIRVQYQTPANPGTTYSINLRTRQKTVLKDQVLPNGHDPDEYIVERKFIAARDGARVPVTLLRHKSTQLDGSSPLFLYGYGSYGQSIPPGFRSSAVSMADRGVIYAIAHIRGGGDMGQGWYLDGKMENKYKTFNDFIDVAERLTDQGYGRKGEVVIEGGSAGGMLVGVVLNKRPDLFGGAIADVPFVDVLNTMSDATLPLTPGEWTEWGNPIRDQDAYFRLKSYCPYTNVSSAKTYPPVLALAGLADFRVTYWEPAKWIAKLRDLAQGGPFFLKTNMNSGHHGSAARFDSVKETAMTRAFALQLFEKMGYDLRLRVSYPQAAAAATPQPPGPG